MFYHKLSLITKELLQIEDNWQRETKDLLKAVSSLQEENKRLQDRLVDTKQAVAEEVAAVTRRKCQDQFESVNNGT